MGNSGNKFELDYKEGKIKVERHTIAGTQIVYRVLFSDGRPALLLTRANHWEAFRFWTSIPEGRQDEADEIGPYIQEYYKQ